LRKRGQRLKAIHQSGKNLPTIVTFFTHFIAFIPKEIIPIYLKIPLYQAIKLVFKLGIIYASLNIVKS
jgi:hypothetical protein